MSGCEGYDAIARVYDQLNRDLDYGAWAEFFETCFARFLKERPELVLDLACGTGRMSRELAARGYDVIGVDGSADMLSEAYGKEAPEGAKPILYLCQDMRELELYGTVGAVVCCLDSLNYLLEEEDLRKVFSLVHNYLDPDGLFLFDVNTPYKFEHTYGNQHYIFEDNDSYGNAAYCGWQNEYDPTTRLCNFYLSVFTEEEDGKYTRCDEVQTERCYTREELTACLEASGFEVIGFFSDFGFSEPDEKCERWYIVAKAKK